MNSLTIVAHPDDEVIWMGGYILRHKNFRWFAISVCYGSDVNRANAFAKSCRKLGIYAHKILNYPDDPSQINEDSLKTDLSQIISKWEEREGNFNHVFTHNKDSGEYGHEVHKKVGRVVVDNKNDIFSGEAQVLQFNYSANFPPNKTNVEISDYERHEENRMEVAPTALNDSSKYLFLRYDELVLKLDILSNIYAAQRADFKNLSWPCPNPEAFIG